MRASYILQYADILSYNQLIFQLALNTGVPLVYLKYLQILTNITKKHILFANIVQVIRCHPSTSYPIMKKRDNIFLYTPTITDAWLDAVSNNLEVPRHVLCKFQMNTFDPLGCVWDYIEGFT